MQVPGASQIKRGHVLNDFHFPHWVPSVVKTLFITGRVDVIVVPGAIQPLPTLEQPSARAQASEQIHGPEQGTIVHHLNLGTNARAYDGIWTGVV